MTDTQDKEGDIFDKRVAAIHSFFHCDCLSFLLNYPIIIESNYCGVQLPMFGGLGPRGRLPYKNDRGACLVAIPFRVLIRKIITEDNVIMRLRNS